MLSRQCDVNTLNRGVKINRGATFIRKGRVFWMFSHMSHVAYGA